jgi:hypothetical protein
MSKGAGRQRPAGTPCPARTRGRAGSFGAVLGRTLAHSAVRSRDTGGTGEIAMGTKTALLTAALIVALPALADKPSNPTHKTTHSTTPKGAAPKSAAPRSPRIANGATGISKGQSSGNTYETERVHATFSRTTMVASPGGIGSNNWGNGTSTPPKSQGPLVRQPKNGSGSIASATKALGTSSSSSPSNSVLGATPPMLPANSQPSIQPSK